VAGCQSGLSPSLNEAGKNVTSSASMKMPQCLLKRTKLAVLCGDVIDASVWQTTDSGYHKAWWTPREDSVLSEKKIPTY